MPKLTPRQRAFLTKLQELYQEHKRPVHYSDIAERLGVNRFSAYDMLKVLEKKGVATSSYALAEGHSGPGRSMVVFMPTESGALTLDEDRGEDWPSVRARVLAKLRSAHEADYREALEELLARLPDAKSPLVFCTEMVGVLLLNMRRARTRAAGLNPFRALASLRSGGDDALESLAGLSVGVTLSTEDDAGPSITHRLLDYARRYQSHLSDLSSEARSALVQFLEEALEALD